MNSTLRKTLISLALVVFYSGTVSAIPIEVTGDSLNGATGELDVTFVGGSGPFNYNVTWSLDMTNFDADADGVTGHTNLTEVAFKIAGMDNVTLLDNNVGTLYWESNVNSDGCDTDGSRAGVACVSLDPFIDATDYATFSVGFNVDLGYLFDYENYEIAFRGKYGDSTGWVISESVTFVPEPATLTLLGLGLFGLGFNRRKRL